MSEPPAGGFGFWDYVKRPWLRDLFGRVLPTGRPRKPPDERAIRERIRLFLESEPSRRTLDWLTSAGPTLVPPLLDALQDPAIRDAPKYSGHALADRPLETVLDLLEPFGAPEAVEPLTRLLGHEEDRNRKLAALALGSIGAPACVEPLDRALADEDEYVRSYALMGIRRAVDAGRASTAFRTALFDRVARLLGDPGYNPAEQAPLCLLDLDRPRAEALLTSPDHLRRETPNLLFHLRAINEKHVIVPAQPLRELLTSVRAEAAKYPWDDVYAEGLVALARSGDLSVAGLCQDALTWGNDDVRTGAAKALTLVAVASDPHGYVFDRLERVGAAGLTEPQTAYAVLYVLDTEVRNGGFAQYYVNPSGDDAAAAPGLARRVGAGEVAKLIERANALFGPQGPPRDTRRRHQLLAAFTPAQDDELKRIDDDYYKSPEKLEVLLRLFVVEHADHFRDPSESG